MSVDRRKFLRFAAGGLAGAAASGASLTGIGKLNSALDNELVRVPGGKETWALGVCTACPGACGLRIRKIGNRAVKIQGNPLHPVNRGRLCPKGLAALQELYHPDRLRQPLHNVGSRTTPKWKQVAWDEALGAITNQFKMLRDSEGTVAVLDRRSNLLESPLLRQFASAYSSGAYFAMPSGLDGTQSALQFQQGVSDPVAFDLGNSRYVLNFGVNLLEGWGAPVGIMRAFARWRTTDASRRTKLVDIEPRFSVTAGRADEWVSIRPGTEASLALGIAYALISEGLYDSDFVRDHTFGFDDWHDADGNLHTGFRTLVTNEYRLNDVAALTRVPAEVILRIAREAAQNRPAIAIGPSQTSMLSGDTYSSMAVHSLNALLGSIDVSGGVLIQQAIPGMNQAREASVANALELPGIASSNTHGISALIIHQANPILTLPNGSDFRDMLTRIPLVVSMTAFMDDTSAMADYVLPITSTLESWQGGGSPPTVPNAIFSLAAPSVRPRANVRHAGEIVLALARASKTTAGYNSFEEYLKAQTAAIFAAQSGAVFGSNLEDTWNRLLERSGWWSPSYSTADELWDQILQQGGWWEPAYSFGESSRMFRTASGRFEFYSQALRTGLREPESGSRKADTASRDRACLPHQPPLPETTSNFPLLLLPIETLPMSSGNGAHLPYLQQIAGEHLFANWDSWLEIHPDTAHEFGISEGDLVWIESRRGRVQAKARVYEGARPGVVHLPLGYGSRAGSSWACRGADALSIGDLILDPVTNRPVNNGTCVKVYKA